MGSQRVRHDWATELSWLTGTLSRLSWGNYQLLITFYILEDVIISPWHIHHSPCKYLLCSYMQAVEQRYRTVGRSHQEDMTTTWHINCIWIIRSPHPLPGLGMYILPSVSIARAIFKDTTLGDQWTVETIWTLNPTKASIYFFNFK